MSFKSIRVLRDMDMSSPQDFEEGDIVKIYTNDSYGGRSWSEYVGKIIWIDTEWIEVDCSLQYKSDIRKFKFKDFYMLEKIIENNL